VAIRSFSIFVSNRDRKNVGWSQSLERVVHKHAQHTAHGQLCNCRPIVNTHVYMCTRRCFVLFCTRRAAILFVEENISILISSRKMVLLILKHVTISFVRTQHMCFAHSFIEIRIQCVCTSYAVMFNDVISSEFIGSKITFYKLNNHIVEDDITPVYNYGNIYIT